LNNLCDTVLSVIIEHTEAAYQHEVAEMAPSSSDLEGFHAFITGAAGVVGSHIIQEFLGTFLPFSHVGAHG
jgi:hypothetical protein